MEIRRAKPIVKWVGGKGRELDALIPLVRERLAPGGTLGELFFGGGALSLAMSPSKLVIAEASWQLRHTYRAICASPTEVSDRLREMEQTRASQKAYLAVRAFLNKTEQQVDAMTPGQAAAFAAAFLYVNKRGFNGLWRVNKKGECNVPYGKSPDAALPSAAAIDDFVLALSGAAVLADWTHALHVHPWAKGDCLFLDPPYEGTFTGYTPQKPSMVLLSEACQKWAQDGVGLVVTLPDSEQSDQLFGGFLQKILLHRPTGIAASTAKRGTLKQAVYVSPI